MRNKLWLVMGGIGIGLCVLVMLAIVIALVLTATTIRRDNTTASRQLSPNGSRVLVTSINTDRSDPTQYLCVRFEIRDAATDAVEYSHQTGASSRMRWSMRWVSDTLIRLDSADIGTYCWELQSTTGQWQPVNCPP